ncbi:MAG: restriction endonuclease subunit S, partial [Lachnospiraceae bacterium]
MKCIEDEIPFDVPEGWEWERMQNITCKIGAGSTPTGGNSVYSQSGIKFIRSQNVYEAGLILNDIAYISEEINNKKSGSIVKPMDILLNITGGSIGRSALVPDTFDIGNVNQHVLIVRLVNLQLRHFIHLFIISPYVQKQILKRQVGSGRGGLSATTFSTFLIPIPPLNEQNQIKYKAHDIVEMIKSLTDDKELLLGLIEKTKSKILDLAIQGKLVPQNPDDEPASILLERIRVEKEELIKAGKIKRDKKESIIYKGDDNSYYEKIGNKVRCIDSEIPF